MTTSQEYFKTKKKKKLTSSEYFAKPKPPVTATTHAPQQPPVGNLDEMLKQYEAAEQSTLATKAPIDTFAEHRAKMATMMTPLPGPGRSVVATVGLYPVRYVGGVIGRASVDATAGLLYPVRYVGGVIGRAAETFEQSVLYLTAKGYQKLSSYKPQFPEGYNTLHIWGRIFQPGKFYRLDEKILTQQDWDTPKGAAINFAIAVTVDPLTWAGVKPSKLALGRKAVGGLSSAVGDANVVEKYIRVSVPARLQFVKDIADSMKGTPEGDIVSQHLLNVTPDVEQAMKTPHVVDIKKLARAEEEALKQLNSTLSPEFRAAQEPLFRSALETARGNVDPKFMEMAELYPELKNPQLSHGAVMKFFSKATDVDELVERMKYVGADEKFLNNKNVKTILDFTRKNPDKIKQILGDTVRMSEKMKMGDYSYVIGPGAGMGFYRLSWEGDPLAKIRPAMAASLRSLEELTSNWDLGKMIGGKSKNGRLFKMPLDPLIIKPLYEIDKVTGETHVVGGDIVGNIDMNLKRMKRAQRASVIKNYFNFQEDVHTQIFEPMKELGLNPRDVFEYTELGAEEFVAKYGMDHAVGVEPFAGILRRKFDETAIERMGYKNFSLLANYITRVALKNDKNISSTDAFIKWRFKNTDEALKRNGMWGRLVARRFANPSMRITSLHDLARSRDVPGWLQNELRLNKYLRELEYHKGNTDMVAKLDADAAFAEKMAMDYTSVEHGGRGLFPPEMGPIKVNEGWVNEYGAEINEFVQSPEGISWGFPAGSTADSFKIFSEDPEHVLSTYAKGYAQSMGTGEIFDDWLRDFGLDPSKYELAVNLTKTGKDYEKQTQAGVRIYDRLTKALERKLLKATGKGQLANEIEMSGKDRRNYLRLKQQMLKQQLKSGVSKEKYGDKIIDWKLNKLEKGVDQLVEIADKEKRAQILEHEALMIIENEKVLKGAKQSIKNQRLAKLTKEIDDLNTRIIKLRSEGEEAVRAGSVEPKQTELIKPPPLDTTVTDFIKQGNAKLEQADFLEKRLAPLQAKLAKLSATETKKIIKAVAVESATNEKAAKLNSKAAKLLAQAQEMREKNTYTPKQIQIIMDLGLKIKKEGQALKKETLAALKQNVKDYHYNERQLRRVKYLRRDGKAAFRTALKINKWREQTVQVIGETVEKAGVYMGKAGEMAVDPTNEVALAIQEANRVGKKIVNLRDWLDTNKTEVTGAEWLLGKLGKKAEVYMDEDAAIKFVEMADAQRKLETPEWQNWLNHYQRFWVNNLLFVQLRTVFGNIWGDNWQRILEGMEPRYALGYVGYQIIASEGQIIKGMPFGLSGLADNAVLDYDVYGKPMYVGDMRYKYKIMDVREGFYAGPVYENADKFGFAKDEASPMGKAVQEFVKEPSMAKAGKVAGASLPTAVKAVKSGGIPAVRRLYRMVEENGRISTFAWFKKQGLSDRDAYEKVMEVHFPYSEMNAEARKWFPFYFWNMKNLPRQLKYWMKKPGLQQFPFKIGSAIDEYQTRKYGEEPDNRSDYLKSASVLASIYKGKPIYLDYSNLFPPAVAEQVIGTLNSDNPMDAVQQILENIGSMSGPGIKVLVEQIYNEKLFTHQPIADDTEDSRAGTSQFWGIDISGNRGAQRVAHVIDTFFPVPTSLTQLGKAAKGMPKSIAVLKMMFGMPFRVDDPILAGYIDAKNEVFPLQQRIKKLQAEYEKKLNIVPVAETDKIRDDIIKINEQMAYHQASQNYSLNLLSALKELKYQIIIAKDRKETERVKELEAMMESIYTQYREQSNRLKQRGK